MTESTNDNQDENPSKDRVAMVIDADRCIAGGQCEMLAPDTFLVDDDTAIASVIGTGLLLRRLALEVIDRCPAAAISLATTTED